MCQLIGIGSSGRCINLLYTPLLCMAMQVWGTVREVRASMLLSMGQECTGVWQMRVVHPSGHAVSLLCQEQCYFLVLVRLEE
jgi:hypothetical protein